MKLKKVVAVSAAMAVALSSVMGVSAASLKDLFDAQYYPSSYEDVKEAFGEDEEALFQHFEQYGIGELRKASPYFDIRAYRDRYPDLEEAFGDDWAAYYEHYLTYGAEEGRNPFTDGFDYKEYADRYPDLKEAFGYDAVALYKHFLTAGAEEGRNPAAPTPVPEEPKAADNTESDEGSSEKPDGSESVENPAEDDDSTVSGGDPAGSEGTDPGEDPDYSTSGEYVRPADGEIIIPYSMEHSVYFYTLDQYKYNPAVIIAFSEDTPVKAYASGSVIEVSENVEVGNYVVMDLGDGYQVTYGQLKDITVEVGDEVEQGETFALIASPTKYYFYEGPNLYLKLTHNGTPVNPEVLFQ